MTGETVSLAEVRRRVMKVRTFFLETAGISLVLTFAGAIPAVAQNYGHTPQVSTPAEKAQTQQLNEQAINGTVQSPAELTGQEATQQMAQSDQPQQYQNQQQQYDEQRAQYREDRRQYVRDVRRYDLARYEWSDYPRVYVYHYAASNRRSLSLIAAPTPQPPT